MKFLRKIYILIILISFSCNLEKKTPEEAINYNNKAIALLAKVDIDSLYIDSALLYIDKAIEIDKDYFQAYYHKSIFLFMKKDYNRLLDNNKMLQFLKPENPKWIIHEGLINELMGKLEIAQDLYAFGIEKYKLKIDNNSTFIERVNFIESLILSGQKNKANQEIEILKLKFSNNPIYGNKDFSTFFKSKEEILKLLLNDNSGNI